MATDRSEFSDFCDFVVQIRNSGGQHLTPEQSVEQFRAEQEKLRKFHERNAIAEEQMRRGEYRPLDLEALLNRVEQSVAEKGAGD
jgi:hypothetical protein